MNPSAAPISFQLDQLVDFMLSPLGVLALALVPLLAISMVMNPTVRWILIAVLLWIVTFGLLLGGSWFRPVLIAPLETVRMIGEPAAVGLLTIMLPAAFFAGRSNLRRPSSAATAFLIFTVIINLR